MDSVDSGLPGGHSPAHWYDTWDRQASQNFSTTTKGLRNAPGENNCFLNSAVQVFWHIDVFRRSYRRLSGHLCMGHSCIFCALKVIFTQFQYSDQSSLQPSALRKALANTFEKQERFKLGHMDDAAECFENILLRIHYHIASSHNEDTCNAPHCIPHQKFAMTVCDQLVCPCGSASEPLKFHEIVHYISANALVSQARMMQETGDTLHPSRFGLLLRNAGAIGNIRDCPGNCGKRVQIRRTLTNIPDVVSIGLVWGSDKPDSELTTEVARNIGTTILLPDIFHSVMCNDVTKLPRLHLTSVVCYYGKHYSTFVWHTKLQEWIYFDDATVRQVGKDWDKVVEKIVRSRYQPLLLIYTNLNASPVATETAPSTRVMAPGYSMNQEKNLPTEHKSSTDKSNSRRSLKSEKGEVSVDQDINSDLQRKSSFEHRRQSSFLLAVTKQKHKEEAIYAVPHNNSKVVNLQKDVNVRGSPHSFVPCQGSGFTDIPEGLDVPDGYNYTLSNNDQYRRPGLNSPDPSKFPLTPNFSRVGEAQRKDSFKKGKGPIPADIIRYTSDPSRRSSVSSESDAGSPARKTGPASESMKPALPVKPKHIRMRSQSVEENLAESGVNSQHKVVKPVVSGPTDSITRAHTPVQSGLATLPRKKKASNIPPSSVPSVPYTDNRAGSQHLMAANYVHDDAPPPYSYHNMPDPSTHHSSESDVHSRQSSSSSILSQGTVIDCSQGYSSSDNTHYRQSSSASQDTLTDKSKEKSKSKKEKEEKKERKQRKEEKKQKSKKDKEKSSLKPPALPDKQGPRGPKDEGFVEDQGYIDRRMVESVLSFQKLQRSGSCLSHTSNSSLDSDLPNRGLNSRDTSTEIPFDQASLDSHKDSGYGSSDRNSSSSTGSITMNPYEQYFLSRSMIPPKTFNHQVMAENMRKLMDQGSGITGLEYTQESDLKALVPNAQDQQYNNNLTVGHVHAPPTYHSNHFGKEEGFSGPHGEQKDKFLYDAVSGRNKATPQLPPYQQGHPPVTGHPKEGQFPGQGQGQGHFRDQQQYKEENEQFIGLCSNAEDLMDSCVLSETSEQYADALTCCQQAIDNLKIAMRLPNIGQSSYTFAQKKSNSCLLKSRSLQKRLMYSRQESNTSTNSSDSVALDNRAQRSHPPPRSQHLAVPSNGVTRPPSRTSSQTSIESMKEGSVPSSGPVIRSTTPVHDRPPVEERVPPMHGQHNPYTDRSFETNCSTGGDGNMYGSLPRRKSPNVRMCNNQKQEEEVYQDFSDNPWQQGGNHSRTSSGAHTPVNDPDYIINSNLQGYHRPLPSSHNLLGATPNLPPNHTVPSQHHSEVGTPPVTNQHGNQTFSMHGNHGNKQQCFYADNDGFNAKLHQNDTQQTDNTSYTTNYKFTQNKNLDSQNIHSIHSQMTQKLKNTEVDTIVHTAYSYPVKSNTTIGQCMEVILGQTEDSHYHGNTRARKPGIGPYSDSMPPRRPVTRSASFTKTGRPSASQGDGTPACKPRLGLSSKWFSGSQPDLNKLKSDIHLTSISHPNPSSGPVDTGDSVPVSVRDLKSRFEKQDNKPDTTLTNGGHPSLGRVNSEQVHSPTPPANPHKVQRQRSKSESESLHDANNKPKSVLTKRGKHGEKMNKIRKSVTFSSDICAETGSGSNKDVQTGYQNGSDGRSTRGDGDSSSSNSPVEVIGERACMLCHKLGVELGQSYCDKCNFYMGRFAPS